MKELLTLPGGYPREIDYTLNLQNELLTLGNSLFATLKVDLILAGCDVHDNGNGTINLAPGVIYIGGEALRYDGDNNVIADSSKTFVKGAYTATDTKVFGDGSPKNVYREAKAVIANATSSITEIKIKLSLYNLKSYIQDCVTASERKGAVKELYDLDGTFLANFDGTGLGISVAWNGWALDNGNNGTPGSIGMATIAAGTYTDPTDGTQVVYTAGTAVGNRTEKLTANESGKPAGLPPGLVGPRGKPGDGSGGSIYYVSGPLSAAADASLAHNNMQPSMPLYRVVKIV